MAGENRSIKGASVGDLVKTLRIYRRSHSVEGLSRAAKALLDQRIIINGWYPIEAFLELLDFTYHHLLDSKEEAAFEMGVRGGEAILAGPHRGFIQQGDPTASVMAMRHTWRAYFNFGELTAELLDGPAVQFTVTGYPDVTEPHGIMIAAWDVAAARIAGARGAGCQMLERPWDGGECLRYRVDWA